MEPVDIGPFEQRSIYLKNWDAELTVIYTSDGPFFLIRELCAVLGVADVGAQVTRLKEHATLRKLVRQLPLSARTGRGRRVVNCIHRRGIGFWWGSIQLAKVRAEVQDQLAELQEQIVDLADRALFGEVASPDVEGFMLMLEKRVGHIEKHLDLPPLDEGDEEL